MRFAKLSIQKVPVAVVMVSAEEFEDTMLVRPMDLQLQLNAWVFLVKDGFNRQGHQNYGKCRVGCENLSMNPGPFLFELLMIDGLEWQDLEEEELPF